MELQQSKSCKTSHWRKLNTQVGRYDHAHHQFLPTPACCNLKPTTPLANDASDSQDAIKENATPSSEPKHLTAYHLLARHLMRKYPLSRNAGTLSNQALGVCSRFWLQHFRQRYSLRSQSHQCHHHRTIKWKVCYSMLAILLAPHLLHTVRYPGFHGRSVGQSCECLLQYNPQGHKRWPTQCPIPAVSCSSLFIRIGQLLHRYAVYHFPIILCTFGLSDLVYLRYVVFVAGAAIITVPGSDEIAYVEAGKNGLLFAADTAALSSGGHVTYFNKETFLMQIPTAGGIVPNHTVLYTGQCRGEEMMK